MSSSVFAQTTQPVAETNYYLIHSSGNVLAQTSEGRAIIQEVNGTIEQLLQFVPDGSGYYWIKPVDQNKYMALSGSWNTYFISDSTTNESLFAIEKVSGSFVKLKCKSNGKYLGTDNISSGSNVYADKSGTDSKHYWYISTNPGSLPVDTLHYLINPASSFAKPFEGWGVSLCWWANMCGKWSDEKIDEIIDWLVSPDGLNYRIFRYNIGGGDDPLNRNCTPHHMANGKGIRAEMEGFKDSVDAPYNWSRDEAQRKIMLKIKQKRSDAIFEAFSNSPPYYMTYSGCCAGNTIATQDNLKPEYYEAFAHYLVDVCKFYKDSFDIEFKTLEPFNEPVTNYWKADGGQEGCYFSTSSQIAFLKVLAPVLNASGLNTRIAASDETSASQSVISFKAYQADGVALQLVGQWNAHTYSATNKDRAILRALSTASNKTLWMSEVGAGGTGLAGNLSLAQKLMDDIRYIRPEAWLDWQYMEEKNDQWCTIRGDFENQTYYKVKNYYVRQQFSRYIPAGSYFLSTPNDKMLAALTPGGESLVVVCLNDSDFPQNHAIDLSLFGSFDSDIQMTRTSETENNTTVNDFNTTDSLLYVQLPQRGIATIQIQLTRTPPDNTDLQPNVPYLIVPRTADLVLGSSGSNVIISNYQYADSTQLWNLTSSGSGNYVIRNLTGQILTDQGTYYLLPSSTITESGQDFLPVFIGDGHYKILSDKTEMAFDLEGANDISGTKIGLYTYGTTDDAVTRQWMFVPAPALPTKKDYSDSLTPHIDSDQIQIVGIQNAVLIFQVPDYANKIRIFNLQGQQILQQSIQGSSTRIPVKSGIYLVEYTCVNTGFNNTVKVIVY